MDESTTVRPNVRDQSVELCHLPIHQDYRNLGPSFVMDPRPASIGGTHVAFVSSHGCAKAMHYWYHKCNRMSARSASR
jgi:hypothetical protein